MLALTKQEPQYRLFVPSFHYLRNKCYRMQADHIACYFQSKPMSTADHRAFSHAPPYYGTVKQTFSIVGGVYLYHLHFQYFTEGHHQVWSLWLTFTLSSISHWATSAGAMAVLPSFLSVPKHCLCFLWTLPTTVERIVFLYYNTME